MSTTSTIPKQWANKPWPILSSPQGQGQDIKSHYSVLMATDMCHIHNIFIRSMNSIYLQAPYVKEPSDIADLLFYTKALVGCINAHHDGEEKWFFPDLAEYTKNPEIMAVNKAQHASFHKGIQDLKAYCEQTTPADYTLSSFKGLIDEIAPLLFEHLKDEIASILELKKYPSKDMKKIWDKAGDHINDDVSFDELVPLSMGCADRGFESGQYKFPPGPKFLNMTLGAWFSRKHKGAWRFNPSDAGGKPRPLHFLPQEDGEGNKGKNGNL